MLPHQDRVVEEQEFLTIKLDKLIAFETSPDFSELSKTEQGRLKSQIFFMSGYSDILRQRIEAFTK